MKCINILMIHSIRKLNQYKSTFTINYHLNSNIIYIKQINWQYLYNLHQIS